ncbi:MAG: helix-turn-helix domain-containing protein [Spirochaetaceae bacterium]|jgi:transcriptional regulator with XRE-family HTH domain|nr:helix-turn-helix domain-containing protein [Spirochaetaceae bacterium]
MGFRENLKSELNYQGLLVKELAARTGISKYTIDNYLNTNGRSPSAASAIKIACVLGVSVDYLVNGEKLNGQKEAPPSKESRSLVQLVEKLPEQDRKIVLSTVNALVSSLKEHTH